MELLLFHISSLFVVSLSVVEFLFELRQEMTVRLKRKRERMMSICLTRFTIIGLGETTDPKLNERTLLYQK